MKPCRRASRARPIVRINFQPGIDERPDQPRPDGSLMIRGVAGTQIAKILWFVVGMVRAASERRPTGVSRRDWTVSSTGFQCSLDRARDEGGKTPATGWGDKQ